MDSSPLFRLPQETLHQIFSHLPVRQIILCKSVCKFFNHTLSSPYFLHLISTLPPPLPLLALRHVSHDPTLHVFDSDLNQWLRVPLSFLPFRSHQPVASSLGLVYVWVDSSESTKSLVVCNPLNRSFKALPPLRLAWWLHGSVLVGSPNRVIIITQDFTLYYSNSNSKWVKFSSNLPSKPHSPILIKDTIFALCDVVSPQQRKIKLFKCKIRDLSRWTRIEKYEWGIVFEILKRPRLVRGMGNSILMIGELISSFSLDSSRSRISIFRLDLNSLEWDEASRMPIEIYRRFQGLGKFKVFGSGARVCFSAKRVKGLAVWDCTGGESEWRWIKCELPTDGDGFYRGFMFEAHLTTLP
ncbi:hypothetical protein LguiB_010087 [Lonicera macranthoides]